MSALATSRGRFAAIGVALSLMLILLALASAARGEGWRSAQPLPPPSGEEQSSLGVPAPLGQIGDIEFWTPNRGLLITAGNQAVPAGLYYYDGVSWRELSTVCGGTEGRIAWAGPDDFWTISDQQTGQQLGAGVNAGLEGEDRSLCHFVDGRVVASYAEPIGVPASYQRMDAAACSGPNDCWFGGEVLPPGPNSGAFHLHWNGSSLTALPSTETPEPQLEDPARKVADIVSYKGRFYESVQVQASDQVPSESPTQPYFLHRIVDGSSKPFTPLITEQPLSYGAGVSPSALSAFRFSGDENDLWALAGPNGSSSALTTALLLGPAGFRQIALSDPSGALAGGEAIGGVAAEPGSEAAWVSLDPTSGPESGGSGSSLALARLARINSNGAVEPQTKLPETDEALGRKGVAGAIACPAPHDCWVATAEGWLFHLGGAYPRDGDPSFQTLISYRPPDASLPFVAPDEPPPDDSGDNPGSLPPLASEVQAPKATTPPAHEALFSNVKEKLIKGTTLALTFTLATKSHVQLLALRGKRKVAATKRMTLGGGRHTLKLALSPRRWPTKLDLQVKAIGVVPLAPSGSGEANPTGGPTVVGTLFRAPAQAPLMTSPLSQLP